MPKTVISAKRSTLTRYLKQIWQYKSLIVTLARRDLKIKYAQTALGLAWTVVQPLVAVIIYTLFFSTLLKFDTKYPYSLFVLSGVLLWGLFNYVFSQGSTSLNANQDIIRKLCFPKIILPFSKVLVAMVEFAVIFILFILLLIYHQQSIPLRIFVIVIPVLTTVFFALGLSLFLSAATVKNRDLNHIIPFFVYFGIWLTPVFYPVSIIPEKYAHIMYLNPMVSAIQMFRWCFFGESLHYYAIGGLLLAFLVFLGGFLYFRFNEDEIIDLL